MGRPSSPSLHPTPIPTCSILLRTLLLQLRLRSTVRRRKLGVRLALRTGGRIQCLTTLSALRTLSSAPLHHLARRRLEVAAYGVGPTPSIRDCQSLLKMLYLHLHCRRELTIDSLIEDGISANHRGTASRPRPQNTVSGMRPDRKGRSLVM
jgi:hypothetical protein